MGAFLKKLWTDPAYFATVLRTIWSAVWGLVASGILPLPYVAPEHAKDIGLFFVGTGVALPAGQTNPPVQSDKG